MQYYMALGKNLIINALKFQKLVACQNSLTNSADPDQTASSAEAVWSGSTLFAILSSILWIPILKTDILERKDKSV